MGGSSSVRGDQTIYHTDNMCFDGTDRGSPMSADGQLWIGATASNRPDNGGHVRLGSLTAGTGITITNGPGTITVSSTAATTDLHVARFIVASSTAGTGANFTTISSAIAAAQGTGINSTIFIQPGTYTENITLIPGINICAFVADPTTPNVTISGTLTLTAAGTVSISGIRLQTNSAAAIAVTGSAASILYIKDCYLNCTNATGITFSAANASSAIFISDCRGNLATTGIALFAHSSTGAMQIVNTFFSNTGASTTASTCSAGVIDISNTQFYNPINTSSTGAGTWEYTLISTVAQNVSCATLNGGSISLKWGRFQSGSASALSFGTTTGFMQGCTIESSNTNAVTGAGTISYSGTLFGSTSTTINTTTQTASGTLQGSKNTAPAAGYLGEQITSGSITGVSLADSTAKTVASITLTPGVWDITAFGGTQYSSFNGTSFILSISTTTNTLQGAQGDQQYYFASTGAGLAVGYTGSVPAFRVVISSSTTYYAVVQTNFASGTCSGLARISGVRVG